MKNLLLFLLKFVFLAVFGLFCTAIMAQSVQNSVIGSTGNSSNGGGVTMDFTVGEIVVETFSAGGNTLTQGFHQTNLTLVAIENTELFPEISIYPNPTSEYINIDIPENSATLEIHLYEAGGKLLKTYSSTNTQITIDMVVYARGTYYLQIINAKDKKTKTFKLVKN